MTEYDNEDYQTAAAQSCKGFTTAGANGGNEKISCGLCKHWDRGGCIKNAYQSVLSRLEYD